ncbi:hypothetical protein D9M70_547380 [compost metagenome]
MAGVAEHYFVVEVRVVVDRAHKYRLQHTLSPHTFDELKINRFFAPFTRVNSRVPANAIYRQVSSN